MENNNNHNGLLSVLTREGVLVNVSVRYWRGCKKLKPEDIGLEGKQLSEQLISLGHKRLLPKDTLANLALIEGRAHALVEANTFPFLNGLGHFLPNSKLAEVTGKLEELQSEFWEAKKAFLQKYSSLRESASKDWRKLAEKLVKDPDQLVATIEASFPYPDQMDRHYGFDIQLFQIPLPQKMTAELVSASEQQAVIELVPHARCCNWGDAPPRQNHPRDDIGLNKTGGDHVGPNLFGADPWIASSTAKLKELARPSKPHQ